MTFKPWIPPAGEVVAPPVHPLTTVAVFYSDGSESFLDRPANQFNWSGEGDGPKIIAYSVVEEYKPAPREVVAWAVVGDLTMYFKDEAEATFAQSQFGGTVVKLTGAMP